MCICTYVFTKKITRFQYVPSEIRSRYITEKLINSKKQVPLNSVRQSTDQDNVDVFRNYSCRILTSQNLTWPVPSSASSVTGRIVGNQTVSYTKYVIESNPKLVNKSTVFTGPIPTSYLKAKSKKYVTCLYRSCTSDNTAYGH